MPADTVINERTPKVAWWRDEKKRAIVIQVSLLALTFYGLATIFNNTVANLAKRGIKTGFDFLSDVANFSIPLNFSPFWNFELGTSEYWEVFVIGIQNTLFISLLGIPAATLLGVFIGILRLSPNALVRWLSGTYIEIFRNTPLLLQLLLWTFALFPPILALLPPVNASVIVGGAVFNSAGFYLPAPIMSTTSISVLFAWLVLTFAAMWGTARYANRRRDETGKILPVWLINIAIFLVALVVLIIVVNNFLELDYPVKKGLNYRGGMRPPIQLIILWFGLVVYTAAFIAECVRGGIKSVNVGQSEASMALGLKRGQRLKLVILPQALRVIIPPTISQFLNLIKNSSLAVAVGYPDITSIWAGLALNQTGQSLIIIGMTVLVYEVLSLFTSWLSNVYNRSVQLTER